MDYIVKLAFVLVIFLFSWMFQLQNQEWDLQRSLLKDANNMALHDAAQELDSEALAQGRIVIDPDAAYAVFLQGIEANLGLLDTLAPKSGSPLRSPVDVVEFKIIDASSGVTFPFLYEDSRYGITKIIQGPSVIAVIRTKHPVLIRTLHQQGDIQVPAIQEYRISGTTSL